MVGNVRGLSSAGYLWQLNQSSKSTVTPTVNSSGFFDAEAVTAEAERQEFAPVTHKQDTSGTAPVSTATKDISASSQSVASSSPERGYTGWRAFLGFANEDPAFAKSFAYDFAYDSSFEKCGPLCDISEYPTIRYSYTGELVTESNLSAFKTEAARATAGRIALYQSEKAKGTPDAEILQKLYSYMDTQSDNYLSKLGWEPKETSTGIDGG